MPIDRVTITGPDDSIRPEDLLPLSKEFPWLEFGILVSDKRMGQCPRYPTDYWIRNLQTLAKDHPLNLSLHLCGRWVRQLLVGEVPASLWTLKEQFQRIQLNFRAARNHCKPREFAEALNAISAPMMTSSFVSLHQFIFQLDGALGNEHLGALRDVHGFNAVGLFDVSGGAGILPKQWPTPLPGLSYHGYAAGLLSYHGYAGGLGPDNLAEQIPLILQAAGDARIWIDMETKVRSEDDRQFDLAKVRQCLEIARPFVEAS